MLILIFFMASLSVAFHTPFLLSTILGLEMMTLALYFSIALMSCPSLESYTSFFFLALVVGEGALGLSLVVLMSRKKGSDFLSIP